MCCLCGCGAIWSGRGRGWRPDSRPVFLVGVHIRCCGNGGLGFRPYGGSLGRAPSNQTLSPLTYGASLWLGMPSLRSCSVGPPPSAIHGRGRLPRHPCRGAHCAEPALGLPTGQIKIKSKIKSQSKSQSKSKGRSAAVTPWTDGRTQTLWRGGLPPFGCEAVAKPMNAVCLMKCDCRF
jgi:hypothetical protein